MHCLVAVGSETAQRESGTRVRDDNQGPDKSHFISRVC